MQEGKQLRRGLRGKGLPWEAIQGMRRVQQLEVGGPGVTLGGCRASGGRGGVCGTRGGVAQAEKRRPRGRDLPAANQTKGSYNDGR